MLCALGRNGCSSATYFLIPCGSVGQLFGRTVQDIRTSKSRTRYNAL